MNRRTFLRRLGGGTLALPFLQLPGRAHAAGEYPTRLLIFFSPNGTKKELWSPLQQFGQANETGWQTPTLIQPMADFKDRLVLFDGLDNAASQVGPGGPHQRGMAALLTGAEITEGDFVGGDGRRAGWGGGVSVDQFIARSLDADTRLRSLELGVRVKEAMPRARLAYAGKEQPLPPENDPVAAFQRIFGDMEADPDTMRRLLGRRQSVLDSVLGDFQALERRVSKVDRQKLERHATALRDLERRLEVIATRPMLCHGDPPESVPDVLGESVFQKILRAQVDIVVNSLACDVTRVASLQCSTAVNALRFTFIGLNDQEGHGLSHAGNSSQLQTQWDKTLEWYGKQFNYLLQRLDDVPEGDGTLLDHTVVLWVNELSRGNNHSLNDIPFLLAGGGGGLRGGRYLKYDNLPHNDLLVSVCHLMGIPVNSFGDARFCNGPLAGLV